MQKTTTDTCPAKKASYRGGILTLLIIAAALVFTAAALSLARPRTRERKGTETNEISEGAIQAAEAEARAAAPSPAEMLSYIDSHRSQYTEALVRLAHSNSEAVEFVYCYKDLKDTYSKDAPTMTDTGRVPLFLQWDKRWGYSRYGSGPLGCTGCGPTALSMVAVYLRKDTKYTPKYIADIASSEGYCVPGNGTAWTLMSEGCELFGLKSEELPLHEQSMAAALKDGKPIICVVGPGDFTTSGHYIVLTAYENGLFSVNDPNSTARSEKLWSYDEIKDQIRNIWAFTAA